MFRKWTNLVSQWNTWRYLSAIKVVFDDHPYFVYHGCHYLSCPAIALQKIDPFLRHLTASNWKRQGKPCPSQLCLALVTFCVTIQAVWIGSLLNNHFLGWSPVWTSFIIVLIGRKPTGAKTESQCRGPTRALQNSKNEPRLGGVATRWCTQGQQRAVP